MERKTRRVACVIIAVTTLGCSDEAIVGNAGTPDGSTASDAVPHADRLPSASSWPSCMPDFSAELAGMAARVLDLGGDPSAPCPGLAGVEICLVDTTNCTISDANGDYLLDIPDTTNPLVAISFQKTGYMGKVRAFVVNPFFGGSRVVGSGMFGPVMVPVDMWSAAADGVGVSIDSQLGAVIGVGTHIPEIVNPAGTTAVLHTAAADGPFYSAALNLPPEPALSAAGLGGNAFFFNVPPGVHALTIDVPQCDPPSDLGGVTPSAGLPPLDIGNVGTIVRSGFITSFVGRYRLCTAPGDAGTADAQ